MVNILKHPIVEHKVSILRNKETSTKEFREVISELAMFLCYEAFKDTPLTIEKEIETPIKKTKVKMFDETKYAFVPILRAGLGMCEGIIKVIPNAKFGHIGLYRDEETAIAHQYYYKVHKKEGINEIVLLDPMLATGGSIDDAIKLLKDDGFEKIKVLSIIAAPEGIKRVTDHHPDVDIYCAVVDDCLNEKNYIVPGLGDAGDRIFGTK